MKRPEQANWLDEAIARTVPGEPPRPDFATWQGAHARAMASLTRRAQRRTPSPVGLPTAVEFRRRIMRSPITKLAVAAALIVGIFILVNHLIGHETAPPRPEPNIAAPEPAPSPQGPTELAQAQTMYEERDIAGLVALLQGSTDETQMKVAEYLGRIGDASAIAALQSLAAKWKGAPDADPFQKAIDAIERKAQPPTSQTNHPEPNAPSQIRIEEAETRVAAVVPGQPPQAERVETDVVNYMGRVFNEAGAPVAGVRVWGQILSGTFRSSIQAEETVTGTRGWFSLTTTRPAAGNEALRILHFDHPDYGTGWYTLERSDKQTRSINVTLFPPAALAGIVIDHQGRPIPGALVEAEVRLSVKGRTDQLMLWDLWDMGTRTDQHGRFALSHLPASARARLRISAIGYALWTTSRGPNDGFFDLAENRDHQIMLEPGNSITGRVIHDDGTPYKQRAIIVVEGPGAHELIVASDDDGRFASPGLTAGLYQLCAVKEQFKSLCKPIDVQVNLDGETPEVLLTVLAEGLPVAVMVVDETTGVPLEGVSVRAEFTEGGEGSVANAKTDEAGQCTLAVPPGRYRIVAQGFKNGQFTRYGEDVSIAPQRRDSAVTLAITARTHVVGQLIDVDGGPVEGFVRIGSGNRVKTDPNGRFAAEEPFGDALEYQPSWAYDTAEQTGKMFLFRKVDYTDKLLIVLEPCVTLTGRIVGQTGLISPDVALQLGVRRPGGGTVVHTHAPWTRTVSEVGPFRITKVPVGIPLQVSVAWRGMQASAPVDELIPGEARDVGELVLRGVGGIDETTDWTGTLEGTITDENHQPVSGATVKAYTGTNRFEAVTDRRGRYRLSGLPKGIRLDFSLYLAQYGHCHEYVYADSDDGDMQIFPQGWELLGKPAPPLSVARWFNSPPQTLEALRGKVVLLQIGVLLPLYGRDLTLMQRMYAKYADQGLEMIAVHQPLDVTWGGKVTEADIAKFVDQDQVPFAFGLDHKRETHRAYAPKATPAFYLIDRKGHVVVSPTSNNVEEWVGQLLGR